MTVEPSTESGATATFGMEFTRHAGVRSNPSPAELYYVDRDRDVSPDGCQAATAARNNLPLQPDEDSQSKIFLREVNMSTNGAPQPNERYLRFDGYGDYVEIQNLPSYSVDHTWEFTVAAWVRADSDDFPRQESGGPYVHWLGKGEGNHERGTQEWVCRMYSLNSPRPKRTSFYVFNPQGGFGVGSYVKAVSPAENGKWRLIVGMADRTRTYLYADGEYADCDTYRGPPTCGCPIMTIDSGQVEINPIHGLAPLRIGTQEKTSYFLGGIAKVRIWNRLLSPVEIRALYLRDDAPRNFLAAEFLLNEGQGTMAYDTANANHGTINGASWATQR